MFKKLCVKGIVFGEIGISPYLCFGGNICFFPVTKEKVIGVFRRAYEGENR